MTSERKLGVFEQTWALMDDFVPVLFVGVLRLSNGPEPDRLHEALSIIQSHHPMLRVGIQKRGGDCFFRESSKALPIPLSVLDRSDDQHWRQVAEDELNMPMAVAEAPLFRCVYLVGEPDSELVFTFHHTIIDSRAGLSLIDELMRLCPETKTVNRDSATQGFPPPMEDLYPERLSGWRCRLRILRYVAGQLREEMSYRLRLRGRQPVDGNAVARNHVLTTDLPAEVTNKIARTARKRGLPLNSVLQAAMLIALRDLRYSGEHLPMRGLSFVDMRPYLSPPPPAEEMGMYISMLPYTVGVSRGTDVWSLAEEVQAQLYRATKRDDKFLAPLLSLKLVSMLLARRSMRIGMAALSYAGPLKLPERYGEIKIRGLSGYVTGNILGPELGAFGTIIHGKLNLDFVYLDTDMNDQDASALVDGIINILSSTVQDEQEVAA